MKPVTKRKPKRKFLPREYGIGDFLSWMHSDGGLRRAVRRVEREDQQMKLFREMDEKDERVN